MRVKPAARNASSSPTFVSVGTNASSCCNPSLAKHSQIVTRSATFLRVAEGVDKVNSGDNTSVMPEITLTRSVAQLLIDGEWRDGSGTFDVLDPATLDVIGQAADGDPADALVA